MSSPEQRKTAERPSEQSTLVGGPLDGGETWTGWVATRVWWLNSVLLLLVFLGVVALLVMVAKTNRKAGEAAGGPTENNDARDDSSSVASDNDGQVSPPETPAVAPATIENAISPETLKDELTRLQTFVSSQKTLMSGLPEDAKREQLEALVLALNKNWGELKNMNYSGELTRIQQELTGIGARRSEVESARTDLNKREMELKTKQSELKAQQSEYETSFEKLRESSQWMSIAPDSPEANIIGLIGGIFDDRKKQIQEMIGTRFQQVNDRLDMIQRQRFSTPEAETITFVIPHYTSTGIEQESFKALRNLDSLFLRWEKITGAVQVRIFVIAKGEPQLVRPLEGGHEENPFSLEIDQVPRDESWATHKLLGKGRLVLLLVLPPGELTLSNNQLLPLPKDRRVDVLLVSLNSSQQLKELPREKLAGLIQWQEQVSRRGGWVNLICKGDPDADLQLQLTSYIRQAVVPTTLFLSAPQKEQP